MPRVLPSPKVIGIVGSRRRDSHDDYQMLVDAVNNCYKKGDIFVSGGCPRGGDWFAELIAAMNDVEIIVHRPREEDLDQELLRVNPRAAYAKINYARNSLIAQDCHILLALVAADRKGGTEDTIRKALRLNKQVVLL